MSKHLKNEVRADDARRERIIREWELRLAEEMRRQASLGREPIPKPSVDDPASPAPRESLASAVDARCAHATPQPRAVSSAPQHVDQPMAQTADSAPGSMPMGMAAAIAALVTAAAVWWFLRLLPFAGPVHADAASRATPSQSAADATPAPVVAHEAAQVPALVPTPTTVLPATAIRRVGSLRSLDTVPPAPLRADAPLAEIQPAGPMPRPFESAAAAVAVRPQVAILWSPGVPTGAPARDAPADVSARLIPTPARLAAAIPEPLVPAQPGVFIRPEASKQAPRQSLPKSVVRSGTPTEGHNEAATFRRSRGKDDD